MDSHLLVELLKWYFCRCYEDIREGYIVEDIRWFPRFKWKFIIDSVFLCSLNPILVLLYAKYIDVAMRKWDREFEKKLASMKRVKKQELR